MCVQEGRGRLRLVAGGQGPREPLTGASSKVVGHQIFVGSDYSGGQQESLASWTVDVRGRELTELGSSEYGGGRGRRGRRAGGLQTAAGALIMDLGAWWSKVESRLGGRCCSTGHLLAVRYLGSI